MAGESADGAWDPTPSWIRLLLPGDPGPGVAEGDRAVEHEGTRPRIGVDAEVAEALELEPVPGLREREARLDAARRQRLERGRIQEIEKRPPIGRAFGILDREEAVVE